MLYFVRMFFLRRTKDRTGIVLVRLGGWPYKEQGMRSEG
jgi:hypothetical protein